jgi:hypothetical protein
MLDALSSRLEVHYQVLDSNNVEVMRLEGKEEGKLIGRVQEQGEVGCAKVSEQTMVKCVCNQGFRRYKRYIESAHRLQCP